MFFLGPLLGAFFAGLIFLILVFVLGKVLAVLVERIHPELRVTNSMATFLGTLLIVALYAILKSGGNTIMWGLIVVVLFFLAGLKRFKSTIPFYEKEQNIKDIITISVYYSFIFLVIGVYIAITFKGDNRINAGYQDNIFYLDIIQSLKKYGSENIYAQLNSFDENLLKRQPYHYFELWMTAMISQLTGVNAFYIFLASLPALLFAFSAFFVRKLSLSLGMSDGVSYFTPFLTLMKLVFLFHFLDDIKVFTPALIPSPKAQVYLLFFYFALYTYLKSQTLALIPLLGLIFVTISSVFAVSALAGFAIVIFLLRKRYKHAGFILMSTLLCFLFLITFYYFNSFIGSSSSQGTGFLNLYELSYRTIVNIIIGTGLQHLILLLPWIISIFLILKVFKVNLPSFLDKKTIDLFILSFILLMGGLVGWAFLYKTPDSVQFFSNTSATLLSVVLVFASLLVIREIKKGTFYSKCLLSLVPFSTLLLVSVFQNAQSPYIKPNGAMEFNLVKMIESDLENSNVQMAGYFMADIKEANTFGANKKVYWRGGAVKLLNEDFSVVTLNVHKIKEYNWSPLDSNRINIYLQESPLYTSDLTSFDRQDHEVQMLYFIKQHQIKFIVVEEGAKVPSSIMSLFGRKSYTDTLSHISYYSSI